MTEYLAKDDFSQWLCAECGLELIMKKVEVQYMGSGYPVDLPICPKCGQIFVPEKLAMTKMAEVERLLEDK